MIKLYGIPASRASHCLWMSHWLAACGQRPALGRIFQR